MQTPGKPIRTMGALRSGVPGPRPSVVRRDRRRAQTAPREGLTERRHDLCFLDPGELLVEREDGVPIRLGEGATRFQQPIAPFEQRARTALDGDQSLLVGPMMKRAEQWAPLGPLMHLQERVGAANLVRIQAAATHEIEQRLLGGRAGKLALALDTGFVAEGEDLEQGPEPLAVRGAPVVTYEKSREAAVDLGEMMDDLVAEVQDELVEERLRAAASQAEEVVEAGSRSGSVT